MPGFHDYRLKFSKIGPIRFVGHLDVVRYLQKANRRAHLPMRYSEGFSPHQILSVALPLSVGATSDGEYLDMSLVEEVPPEEIVRRLNAVMHEGIEAKACVRLPEHAPKAMTVIAAARYRLRLGNAGWETFYSRCLSPDKGLPGESCERKEDGAASPERTGDLGRALREYLSQEHIFAVKTTKKGEQEVDLKPLIHDFTVEEDGTLTALLHAGSRDHVKPVLLYEGFFRSYGREFYPQMLSIHRLDLYESTGDEGGRECFIPLINENSLL